MVHKAFKALQAQLVPHQLFKALRDLLVLRARKAFKVLQALLVLKAFKVLLVLQAQQALKV